MKDTGMKQFKHDLDGFFLERHNSFFNHPEQKKRSNALSKLMEEVGLALISEGRRGMLWELISAQEDYEVFLERLFYENGFSDGVRFITVTLGDDKQLNQAEKIKALERELRKYKKALYLACDFLLKYAANLAACDPVRDAAYWVYRAEKEEI